MCTTCGCSSDDLRIDGKPIVASATFHAHANDAIRSYVHASSEGRGFVAGALAAAHAPGTAPARIVQIEQDLLAKNDALAGDNRRFLADRGIFALNLMSSPGSGKTSLLVRTIDMLQGRTPIAVIEGDQQTSQDANRIRAAGAHAMQINTGKGCHLDADMIGHALTRLTLADDSLLVIENVGNLVCPASFDLGEACKVVILSVTEGEDKPLKYPDMFHAADLLLINKIDLLPYVDFDVVAALDYARRMRPGLEAILMSARTGEGFEGWLAWLERRLAEAHGRRASGDDSLHSHPAQIEAEVAEHTDSGARAG